MEKRRLALLPVLEAAGQALGVGDRRCRVELLFEERRLVAIFPHFEPGKLTRRDIDLLTFEADVALARDP